MTAEEMDRIERSTGTRGLWEHAVIPPGQKQFNYHQKAKAKKGRNPPGNYRAITDDRGIHRGVMHHYPGGEGNFVRTELQPIKQIYLPARRGYSTP